MRDWCRYCLIFLPHLTLCLCVLQLVGEYGLRNKRELWIVKMFLAKIRKAARELLTLDEKDARRLFQGACVCVCVEGMSCVFVYLCCKGKFGLGQ